MSLPTTPGRSIGAWLRLAALIVGLAMLAGCAVPKGGRTAGSRDAGPRNACGGPNQPICEFSSARMVGRAACDGRGFFDPRNGGECWECPAETHRTIFPVTSDRACERPARTEHRPVSGQHAATGIFRTDCRPGFFLHRLSGVCYACPSGFNRTVFDIHGGQACERVVPVQPQRASFQKRFGCAAPSFLDPRHGGECWRCPDRWNRSIFPVNGGKACTAPIGTACEAGLINVNGTCRANACGGEQQRPCLLTERIPSCNQGLVEDFARNLCLPADQTVLKRLADGALNEARPLLDVALKALECQAGPGRAAALDAAIRRKDPLAAAAAVTGSVCFNEVRRVAAANGYQTLTLGLGADVSLGLGANTELGVAIDMLDRQRARVYTTVGYSLGNSAGVNGSLILGFAKDYNHKIAGDGHGLSYGAKFMAGAAVGAGFDYENRLQSMSVTASGGLSAGGGLPVYSRTTTALLP